MNQKENLYEIFELIDMELIERQIPITLRFMNALLELSKSFDVKIPISMDDGGLPNNDFGNYLSRTLFDWYEAKYGDAQSYNADLGCFYHSIRGQLWHYRVPNFYGKSSFFISRDLSDKGKINETNILRMSSNMTQFYIDGLSDDELLHIGSSFKIALDSYHILSSWVCEDLPYSRSIRADLDTVTAQLDMHRANYDQARWSYMQCAEKILKAWLQKADVPEDRLKKIGHNIHKLINEFNKRYEVKLSVANLDAINCSAGARYDEEHFTSEDIILAQEWLFNLIKSIGFIPKLATI
ncbi:conserved hypothetical protein [Vibrio jasicida]|uniref:hypothetical protein n=1 Tax=Vibrio jasicida TaxID=766224 RepID=UPI002895EA9B|nr:conserved hypothetical protein [Vibrio jasicida]HDM8235512.1 HEPN domain-containing protein [Vibrio campbellii]